MGTTNQSNDRQRVKKEKLIESILLWARSHDGRPPTVTDWRTVGETGWPSYITVIRTFGSWDAAIKAAGFKPRGRGRPKK